MAKKGYKTPDWIKRLVASGELPTQKEFRRKFKKETKKRIQKAKVKIGKA